MLARSTTRALILTAIAAVVAYAQCFSNCDLRPCESAQTPEQQTKTRPCHQEEPSPQPEKTACLHQHSDFSGPEVKVAQDAPELMVVAVPGFSLEVPLVREIRPEPRNSSPPGALFVKSPLILRI